MNVDKVARIAAFADLGFVIIFDIRADNPEVFVCSKLTETTKDAVLEARKSDDCIINWLQNSVGTETFTYIRMNAEDASDQVLMAHIENGTAISMLHDGAKIGALLAHSQKELTEEQINDVRSTLILAAESIPVANIPTLGPRELAYLKKVSEGETDDGIAKELNLSMRSVKERKKRTITELGAVNISQAIILAKKSGQL